MTDKIKEQISALVDGELPASEQQLLLARMEKDGELAERWGRYHLVSDVLRGHMPKYADKDLSSRVQAALASEADLHTPRRIPASWMKPVAGLAIAASVAMVAVLSVRSLPGGNDAPVVASAEPAPAASDYVRVEGMRWNRAKPKVADKLNSYLVNHNEFAGTNGVQGMLPYARIVGYDTAPE